jgi:cytochrome oxidase Cu insertion factor (SCO1/SenC/PrrC family)
MKTWILALGLGVFAQAKERPAQGPGADVGKPAPNWKLRTQDGKTEVELAKLRGRPVLLVFGSYT